MRRRIAFVGALLALSSCKPADQPVTLEFRAISGAAPITCTTGPDGRTLDDLRFFIHDVALLTVDGRAVPVAIDVAPPWQSREVALIDLEDGTGTCATGSPATHVALRGRAPRGDYIGVRFTLGVPFALNHADPTEAQPPLDQTAMHWHWLAGYKFLRAGMHAGDGLTWFHLGSTGCQGHIGAVTGCNTPNRPTVTVSSFHPATDVIAVDLGALFADAPPGTETHACQSEPDNALCAPMLHHLGLGAPTQDVFRAMAR